MTTASQSLPGQALALCVRSLSTGLFTVLVDKLPPYTVVLSAQRVGMPNPASAYCVTLGSVSDIVVQAGGQVGVCTPGAVSIM